MATLHARMAGGMAVAALLASCLFLNTGCSSGRSPQMVDSLPPPNFSGPDLTPPPAPAPAPIPAPAPPVPVRPKVVAPVAAVPGVPREWTPVAAPNGWQWIVIHHSATTIGGAARFDKMHRNVQHWDELGYHFVIGNGSDTGDGVVEVGPRWPKQKWGAHAKTPDNRFNEKGIGICLVGHFDQQQPTAKQLESLARLVAHLQKTYRIPADRVIGHSDTKATECPGRNLRLTVVRRMSAQVLASLGAPLELYEPTRTAAADGGTELLVKSKVR